MPSVKVSKRIVVLVLGLLLLALGYCAHLVGGADDDDDAAPATAAFKSRKLLADDASARLSAVLKSGAVEKQPIPTHVTTLEGAPTKATGGSIDSKHSETLGAPPTNEPLSTQAETTTSPSPTDMSANCPGMDTEYPVLPYDTFLRTTVTNPEYAYVSFISHPDWVRLAATVMHSIAATGSVYARCILVTKAISAADRKTLSLYAQIIEIESIPSPVYISDLTYTQTVTKLGIWELEPLYKKVLYIDSDIVLRKNIDELFDIPVGEDGLEWAVAKDGDAGPERSTGVRRTNTGLMLIRPSLEVFDELKKSLAKDYNHGMTILGELLFLNNFFDHVWPGILNKRGQAPSPYKPVTAFISRWYHVFHHQFYGESFMGLGRQWLSIFDERVGGIHFAGKSKPWFHHFHERSVDAVSPGKGFISATDAANAPFDHQTESYVARNLAKYSVGFCHWRDYVSAHYTGLQAHRVRRSLGREASEKRRSELRKEKVEAILKEAPIKLGGARAASNTLVVQSDTIASSVEPFLSSPGFWWFLNYAQMLRVYSTTYANRCEKGGAKEESSRYASLKPCDGIVLDTAAAEAFYNDAVGVLRGHRPVNPSDLYEMMTLDFDGVSGNSVDAMFRAQLGLGAAWGFNDPVYSKRKEGSKGYFTPLPLTGAPLTQIVQQWKARHEKRQ